MLSSWPSRILYWPADSGSVVVMPSRVNQERPIRFWRRLRGEVGPSGSISRTNGSPPFHAASSYGIGTTVVVDWNIVTERVPVVYIALQVLAYFVTVTISARACLLSEPSVKSSAAALRTNIFAPGAEAQCRRYPRLLVESARV